MGSESLNKNNVNGGRGHPMSWSAFHSSPTVSAQIADKLPDVLVKSFQ